MGLSNTKRSFAATLTALSFTFASYALASDLIPTSADPMPSKIAQNEEAPATPPPELGPESAPADPGTASTAHAAAKAKKHAAQKRKAKKSAHKDKHSKKHKKPSKPSAANDMTIIKTEAIDPYFTAKVDQYDCMDSSQIFTLEVYKDKKGSQQFVINGHHADQNRIRFSADKKKGQAELVVLNHNKTYRNSAYCNVALN